MRSGRQSNSIRDLIHARARVDPISPPHGQDARATTEDRPASFAQFSKLERRHNGSMVARLSPVGRPVHKRPLANDVLL